MKYVMNLKKLPLWALILGGVGLILRKSLYAVALDQKNLLLRGHPLEIGLWAVTAVAIALAAAAAWKLNKEELSGSPNRMSAIGCAVLAVGILAAVLPQGFGHLGLPLVRNILGLLAAGALAVAAVLRLKGKPVFFLFYGIVCIFFAVHMVGCYQGWSSNPQIQDYVFTLLSSVGLMLFAYQQTSLSVGLGSQKLMLGIGLMTIFSCVTALSGTEYPALYLAGSIWAATNIYGE